MVGEGPEEYYVSPKEAELTSFLSFPNKVDDDTWIQGAVTPGEGVYRCHNGGSCLAPDTCSCPDGWDGYDCETPLCRYPHR